MNTKRIGTIAEAKIKADLLSKGFGVAEPEGDYLPFDLVVIDSETLKMCKVQVKGRSLLKRGTARIELRRTRFKGGRYLRNDKYKKKDVDIFALYVIDIDECFYIHSKETYNNSCSIELRFIEPKGCQIGRKNLRMARDYKQFPPIVQW